MLPLTKLEYSLTKSIYRTWINPGQNLPSSPGTTTLVPRIDRVASLLPVDILNPKSWEQILDEFSKMFLNFMFYCEKILIVNFQAQLAVVFRVIFEAETACCANTVPTHTTMAVLLKTIYPQFYCFATTRLGVRAS